MNLKSILSSTALFILFLGPHALSEKSKTESLELGRKQYESGNYSRALDILSQTISSTSDANIRNRAFYYQGLSFFEMGLYYSSYLSFRNVLLNPDERFKEVYEKSIKNSVIIADKLNIVDRIGKVLEKMDSRLIPVSVTGLARYAMGVAKFESGQTADAEKSLKSVSPESQFYDKALYYLGILATKRKDYKEANFYFEKLVSVTQGKKDLYWLEELGRLNLARTAYSADNIEKSVELYSKFLSSSPYWLDVLLEASWPLMKMNDTAVSLGNLHTITSPFYRADLVGEAYILRATILYKLCKYEEMRKDISSFFVIYDPVIRAMQQETASLGSADGFFKAYQTKKGLNQSFMNFLSRDQGVQNSTRVLENLSEERSKLAGLSKNEQTQRMIAQVDELKAGISREVGATSQKLHKRKLAELLEQREQANYLKVEVVTGEKELIEGQKGLPAKRVVDVETTVAAGYHFWPYNGEYWEDELGTYIYTTESSCVN
jgi:tetratricopeptide (TPR) repeat protein